mmetsp:Transcript_36532/g.65373  ORF Transcript_36532/g.65373 Transcript_36532/m.65373 type:complete len:223 (+) Transcript_36532:1008-1676(+)
MSTTRTTTAMETTTVSRPTWTHPTKGAGREAPTEVTTTRTARPPILTRRVVTSLAGTGGRMPTVSRRDTAGRRPTTRETTRPGEVLAASLSVGAWGICPLASSSASVTARLSVRWRGWRAALLFSPSVPSLCPSVRAPPPRMSRLTEHATVCRRRAAQARRPRLPHRTTLAATSCSRGRPSAAPGRWRRCSNAPSSPSASRFARTARGGSNIRQTPLSSLIL